MDKKILFNMLCIIFITGINDCRGDLAFKYFASNVQRFLRIAPKAWHNYIRIFMYRYFKRNQLHKVTFNIRISKIYIYSITFMALKDKSLQPVDMIQNLSLYKTNVLWTSGKIFISLPSYKYGSFIFQFYFDLNSELRLNLKFILLHLRGVLLKCQYDKLEVKLNQNLINTKSTYKYCGYYSNFILYPDMHDFIVIISLQLMKPFDLDAFFSVTDKNFISNPLDLALNTKEPLVLIQLLCYKIVRKYYLTSFLVSITKIYRLQIYIANQRKRIM